MSPRFMYRSVVALACAVAALASCDDAAPGDEGSDADAWTAADVADTGPPPAPGDVAIPPPPPTMLRLTAAQYRNVIHDVLGDDIVVPSRLEPDVESAGFLAVGAGTTSVSVLGAELYEAAAYAIAEQVFTPERRDAFVVCDPATIGVDACARETLLPIVRRLWRRDATPAEADALVALSSSITEDSGAFDTGLGYALAAALQSPAFLFRLEVGVPDSAGGRVLTDYELATRLSFLFWNTSPDDALLDAAADGALASPDGLRSQVERLSSDPRARAGVRNFFAEYLGLLELPHLQKDPETFPHFSPDLGRTAMESVLLSVDDVVFDDDADYRELFTRQEAYVDRHLAALYDVPAPVREGFGLAVFPDERRGLLGQAAFLALHSHPASSSATLRGRYVRQVLLCGTVPPPPADVDTSIPEPSADAPTLRERVAVHLEEDACAGCHLAMDPIGLGFENFDGIGRYRELEAGAPIDPSGSLDGVPFDGPGDLSVEIADHPDLAPCFVRNMFRYAHGRAETRADEPLIAAFAHWWDGDGRRVGELMRAIATHPSFRTIATQTEEDP